MCSARLLRMRRAPGAPFSASASTRPYRTRTAGRAIKACVAVRSSLQCLLGGTVLQDRVLFFFLGKQKIHQIAMADRPKGYGMTAELQDRVRRLYQIVHACLQSFVSVNIILRTNNYVNGLPHARLG